MLPTAPPTERQAGQDRDRQGLRQTSSAAIIEAPEAERSIVAQNRPAAGHQPSLLAHPVAVPQQKSRGGIGFLGGGTNRTNRGTAAESQRIVAARPLCRLQYRVASKSSAWDLPQ